MNGCSVLLKSKLAGVESETHCIRKVQDECIKISLHNWLAFSQKLSSISGKKIFLSITWRWWSRLKFDIGKFQRNLSTYFNFS
jgi:hypothetical protein